MKPNLTGLQWAVRGVLCLGVAASVTANILHAQPNPIAQCIAAWPPLALLITVELVSRIPAYRKTLAAVRILATTTIAGIAAWVSYWHMTGVVARYEVGSVPYLLPLSVDGLIVIASVSLVELAGPRNSGTARQPAPVSAPLVSTPVDPATAPAPAGSASVTPVDQPPGTREAEPAVADHTRKREPIDVDLYLDPVPDAESGAHDLDELNELRVDRHDEPGRSEDRLDGQDRTDEVGTDLAPDLVPLLPAARAARDELIGENRAVSRDALARRLRRNGHSIRNSGVSELLAALRQQPQSVNGARPTASA